MGVYCQQFKKIEHLEGKALRDSGANRQLRRLLKTRNMRRWELSLRCGMRDEDLSRILKGQRPIYADELLPLALALGVRVEDLLDYE